MTRRCLFALVGLALLGLAAIFLLAAIVVVAALFFGAAIVLGLAIGFRAPARLVTRPRFGFAGVAIALFALAGVTRITFARFRCLPSRTFTGFRRLAITRFPRLRSRSLTRLAFAGLGLARAAFTGGRFFRFTGAVLAGRRLLGVPHRALTSLSRLSRLSIARFRLTSRCFAAMTLARSALARLSFTRATLTIGGHCSFACAALASGGLVGFTLAALSLRGFFRCKGTFARRDFFCPSQQVPLARGLRLPLAGGFFLGGSQRAATRDGAAVARRGGHLGRR